MEASTLKFSEKPVHSGRKSAKSIKKFSWNDNSNKEEQAFIKLSIDEERSSNPLLSSTKKKVHRLPKFESNEDIQQKLLRIAECDGDPGIGEVGGGLNSRREVRRGLKQDRPRNVENPVKSKRPQLGDLNRIGLTSTIKHLERTRDNIEYSREQACQSQILLQEEAGFIELEPGEDASDVTQTNLKNAVDIMSATKIFDLSLWKYAPYRIDYSRNGRHLLLGGRKGHVAVVEWLSKRLLCEVNVMDSVYEVAWLHQETMFAVAQKDWLYMYDNQGIELHCIEKMPNVLRMEYLPYHFLLATGNSAGFLQWLDISVGKMVAKTYTKFRRLDVMCQNPWNATIGLGHHNGTVTFWSPTVQEPLMTMLCHHHPVRAVTVDRTGNYAVTAATDGVVKVWDLRALKPLHAYKFGIPATSLALSQRGLLAVAMRNSVQVLKDCYIEQAKTPYLYHSVRSNITELSYCPYEDVLGIGSDNGFSSILVPGASEANFDSLETNPYQSKEQRRQQEVKSLLEKIQPEMICLDPTLITAVAEVEDNIVEQTNKTKPDIELKFKTKGKSDTAHMQRRKNFQKDAHHRALVCEELKKKREERKQFRKEQKTARTSSVLDRFKQMS